MTSIFHEQNDAPGVLKVIRFGENDPAVESKIIDFEGKINENMDHFRNGLKPGNFPNFSALFFQRKHKIRPDGPREWVFRRGGFKKK